MLQSIPSALEQKNEFFGQMKCPITQRPIRFIQMVEVGEERATFYERDAIHKWIAENSHQLLPQWPVGVPLQESVLKEAPVVQRKIDLTPVL